MCRSAGCTWKFPMRNWPGEKGYGKYPNLLPAAGTDFFTTTFCRQIRVWISISWLAKVGRRFHGITISPEFHEPKRSQNFQALEPLRLGRKRDFKSMPFGYLSVPLRDASPRFSRAEWADVRVDRRSTGLV